MIVWEDFVESMSQARLEEAYNDTIAQSDIFVMLLSKHAGKYVLEEFEQALVAQRSTGKPFIFTYLKDTAVDATNTDSTALGDLASFRERLDRLGHFYVIYRDSNSLKQHFSAQLSQLLVTFIARDTPSETAITRPKNKVFVSYSHNDREYLDRLLVHLAPLREEKLIDLWVDTTLQPGDEWKKEIERNLSDTGIAVLLVSADFLASEFIVKNELPPLLDAAAKKGTRITPIVVKPCRFPRDKRLSIYQAVNSPTKPLSGENENEREKIYDKVAEWIEVFVASQSSAA